ncbi:MAG: hypothetical protein ABUS57_02645 [Pseudomonadota bacterium]
MKPIYFLISTVIIAVIGGGYYLLSGGTHPGGQVITTAETASSVTTDMPAIRVDGNDSRAGSNDNAVQVITASYAAKQAWGIANPTAGFEPSFFVPTARYDQIAHCTAEALDRSGAPWRPSLPVVAALRDGASTGAYTNAQINEAQEVNGRIWGVTGLCTNQLIPSGEFQAQFQAFYDQRQQIYQQQQQQRHDAEEASNLASLNQSACHDKLYMLDWYTNNPMGRSQDPTGEHRRQAQQDVVASHCQ